jgi:hypothetical protein
MIFVMNYSTMKLSYSSKQVLQILQHLLYFLTNLQEIAMLEIGSTKNKTPQHMKFSPRAPQLNFSPR